MEFEGLDRVSGASGRRIWNLRFWNFVLECVGFDI